jgi:hypothetical protein
MIYGYKLKLNDLEISIYNNYFKDVLLKDWQIGLNPPLHLLIMLYILKTFYYIIPILPKNTFAELKKNIFYLVSKNNISEFLVV